MLNEAMQYVCQWFYTCKANCKTVWQNRFQPNSSVCQNCLCAREHCSFHEGGGGQCNWFVSQLLLSFCLTRLVFPTALDYVSAVFAFLMHLFSSFPMPPPTTPSPSDQTRSKKNWQCQWSANANCIQSEGDNDPRWPM